MDDLRHVQDLELLKVLGDPRRLVILRLLMAKAETLSTLGKILGEHPARVRHHLKLLEGAGLVEMVEAHPVRGFVEKFYQAKSKTYLYQGMILPAPLYPVHETLVAAGSHDLALELLAQQMGEKKTPLQMLALPVGSLDGLVALRQGQAHLAGCHLLDAESGQYNLPFVRSLFPDRPVQLITLVHREQGLLLAKGNSKGIRGLEDLGREDLVFAQRNKGSGTRLWMDRQIKLSGLAREQVLCCRHEMHTHTAVASAIALGRADWGLGVAAAARRFDLDFIPLFHERYDLVVPEEQEERFSLLQVLEQVCSAEFRRCAAELDGYDVSHTGEMVWDSK